MPRVHTVKKAQKDIVGTTIQKGDSYYWWKFRFGGKVCSKTYPKPSQLTRSEFMSTVYDITDRINGWGTSAFMEEVSGMLDELQTLRDEQEEKKSNMPEGLQEGPTGELLQERFEALEEICNILEDISDRVDDLESRFTEGDEKAVQEAEDLFNECLEIDFPF